MGADGAADTEGQATPGLIERLGTKGVIGIAGVAVVGIFLLSRGGDDTPTTTTAPPTAAPTTVATEGPQVAPIDSCGVLPGDDVDVALGIVDENGNLRADGIRSAKLGEVCRWQAEIDDTGETVTLELGPGDQDDFSPDTRIDGAVSTAHTGVGDLAVWFGGQNTGTMSAVTDTANGLLFVKLAITRSDVDDATRRDLAADLVTTAIERIRFGPPPPVEANLCELITGDDAERILAPQRRGRAAARQEVMGGGSPQVVDLTETGERSCQKLILTEIYVTAAQADEADFEPGAQIDGVAGQPIAGIGDEAVYFEDVPGSGSFAAPHSTDIVAVRTDRAMFRIVVALPDLTPAERRNTATYLALAALTHLPDAEGEVIPEILDTPDTAGLGFVDNVLAKEADGEWALGQGIVATLRLFTGQTDAADVLRTQDLADDSGTELIRMAQAYLSEVPTDPYTGQIQRLLDELALPPELATAAAGGEAHRSTLTASTGRTHAGPEFGLVAPRPLLQVEGEEDELQADDPADEGDGLPDVDLGYAPPPDFPDDQPDLPEADDEFDLGQCGGAGSAPGWTASPPTSPTASTRSRRRSSIPSRGSPPDGTRPTWCGRWRPSRRPSTCTTPSRRRVST